MIQTGKFGDVLSALPLAHHLYSESRQPVPFIISKQYAPILDGLEYVSPVVYQGSWRDLDGAIRFG